MLNELVLDRTGGTHLALGCVSAVEAHERIGEGVVVLALDVLVVYVLRNGVVDIEQRNCVSGNAQTDVFAQRAVDIYLAGYRDTAAYKAAVYIAGLKAELDGNAGQHLSANATYFLEPLCFSAQSKRVSSN